MNARYLSRITAAALGPLLAILPAGQAGAQRNRVVVPENTVVRLELAEKVTSRTANRGDRVTATLDENDLSGFPEGTRFEGTVTSVRRANSDRPALLDMEFRRVILPNGASERIDAELASLSEDNLRRTADGRLESRRRGDSFDWKWVGIGAGGGAILGEVFGDDFLKGALLGGLGGAVYGYLNRDRDRDFREVELDQGTEFGIRLDQRVAFRTSPQYRFVDRERVIRDRVSGAREEYRLDGMTVSLNGRAVSFSDAHPQRLNGTLYVPLRPVAEAASWNLRHYPGADEFSLATPAGQVQGTVGDRWVRRAGRYQSLDAAPMRMGGEMYVPLEFLSRVGDMRVDWNRRDRRLNLTSYGSA